LHRPVLAHRVGRGGEEPERTASRRCKEASRCKRIRGVSDRARPARDGFGHGDSGVTIMGWDRDKEIDAS